MVEQSAIGLDLGGTHLRAGLVAKDGGVRHYMKTVSRVGESNHAPLEGIASAVRELETLAGGGVIGVGIGSPGVIDPRTGSQVGETPHLPHWIDFPLRERLAALIGLPVVVDNDANLAALGEHRVGAARGARVSMTV